MKYTAINKIHVVWNKKLEKQNFLKNKEIKNDKIGREKTYVLKIKGLKLEKQFIG